MCEETRKSFLSDLYAVDEEGHWADYDAPTREPLLSRLVSVEGGGIEARSVLATACRITDCV